MHTIGAFRSCVFAAVLGLLAALPVQAQVFYGTFSGIAYDSRIDAQSPWPRDFDGEVVTGSFYLDLTGMAPPEVYDDPHTSLSFPTAFELVFHAVGRTVVFGNDSGSAIWAHNDGVSQDLRFVADWTTFYWFASLALFGPLFDGLDPSTFWLGPVDVPNSSAHFFAGRDFGASVDLTSVVIVPEPAAAVLLVAGLLAGLLAAVSAASRSAGARRQSAPASPPRAR